MKSYEDKTQKYSTWGDKLLQHADLLASIQIEDKFKPVTVQLSLCEMCDSDCPFCSIAARPLKSYIPWEQVKQLLLDFKDLGAKSIEITGGGNPMLYRDKETKKNINDVIKFAHECGFDIGIITNTEKLERHLNPEVYPYINWIRISLIKLDERIAPEQYDFGSFPHSKLGFSYIIYDSTGDGPDELSRTNKPYQGTTVESIERIAKLIELNPNVKFCRIAGNCLLSGHNTEIRGRFGAIIDALDKHDKFFIKEIWDQDKPFSDGCYVGLVRPYIAPHPEGGSYQVYICTSHVLENRIYDLDYSLGDIKDIKAIWNTANLNYAKTGNPYEVRGNCGSDWDKSCVKCFYYNNNKLLHTVSQPMEDPNFP